ncbi:MAG TPA: hypothetical protein DEP37_01390 [Algoriphagus sp.]|nr:hypothetical protein [Algoriphagus sp.]
MSMRTLYKVNAVIQTSLINPSKGNINHNKAGNSAFQRMNNDHLFMKRYTEFVNVTARGGFGGGDKNSVETVVKLAYAGNNVNGSELDELKTDITAFQHYLEKYRKSWHMRDVDMSLLPNQNNDLWFEQAIEKCKEANSAINSMINVLGVKAYNEEEKKIAFDSLNDIPEDAWIELAHKELEEEEAEAPF